MIAKKNSFAHIHGNFESDDEFTKRGLPSAVKQVAVYCIDKHDYTPKEIDAYCVKSGISIQGVHEKQLENFCHKYKKQKNSGTTQSTLMSTCSLQSSINLHLPETASLEKPACIMKYEIDEGNPHQSSCELSHFPQ